MMLQTNEKLVTLVRTVLNKHDPESLLQMGCPADEYEPEIRDISESLYPSISVDDAWLVVCITLHWYFGHHDRPVLYSNKHREIAAEIVAGLPDVYVADKGVST